MSSGFLSEENGFADHDAADPPEQGKLHASVEKRHRQMMAVLQDSGFATIQQLADRFKVTPQTIRRDINILSQKGLLHRFHGGAGIAFSTENVEYSDRKILYHAEKQRIGELTARHIPNKTSLFINIGTTTEEVAKSLLGHTGLKVITNNLQVATTLSGNDEIETYVAGGLVRNKDNGIVGEAAIDFIRHFKADYGIIGISGIDMDGTLLDFDYREVRAARAIMDNSRKVFLVTDHTKFGRNAMVILGTLSEIDAVFTDRFPPREMMEIIKNAGVELFVADE